MSKTRWPPLFIYLFVCLFFYSAHGPVGHFPNKLLLSLLLLIQEVLSPFPITSQEREVSHLLRIHKISSPRNLSLCSPGQVGLVCVCVCVYYNIRHNVVRRETALSSTDSSFSFFIRIEFNLYQGSWTYMRFLGHAEKNKWVSPFWYKLSFLGHLPYAWKRIEIGLRGF